MQNEKVLKNMTTLNEFIATLSFVLYVSKLKIARHKFSKPIASKKIYFAMFQIEHTYICKYNLFGCGVGVNNHRKVYFSHRSFDDNGDIGPSYILGFIPAR